MLVNLLRQPHNMTKEKTKPDQASIYWSGMLMESASSMSVVAEEFSHPQSSKAIPFRPIANSGSARILNYYKILLTQILGGGNIKLL